MILQALYNYYERKCADPESGIAPEGFEYKVIPYVVVIDMNGQLVDVQFTGDTDCKRGKSFLVPMWQQKSGKDSWKTTNLLWDHYGYFVGHAKSDEERDIEAAKKQHLSFLNMIAAVSERLPDCKEILAINRFYNHNGIDALKAHERWTEIRDITNCNLSFRICDQLNLVQQLKHIQRIAPFWNGNSFTPETQESALAQGFCLVSGNRGIIARLHRPISGVNKKPAPFLAVNTPAFESFNKEQGYNFPISDEAAFRYATALNSLLRSESKQKLKVGDVVTVFWADKQSHLEHDFASLFDEPEKDDPDRLTENVRALLKSVDTGVPPAEDKETRFFILGLCPNSARICVRYWHVGSVADCALNIAKHFRDLTIVHGPYQRDYVSIWWLLKAIAALGKSENIPPNLAGDWMRTILNGTPYPETLLQAAIRRSRIEREVNYERASIIKACLNRKSDIQHQNQRRIAVSLDIRNTNLGYLTGRLFAVLEKIQEEASPNINATIRDRYYSAASGAPASVVPILLRMKNHHLGKLEKGREIYFEKLLGGIVNELSSTGFPAQLTLADQGRFAIGYYHQRQSFFSKLDKPESTEKGA